MTWRGSRHVADDSFARTAAGQSGAGKHVDAVLVHSSDGPHPHCPRCSRRQGWSGSAHAGAAGGPGAPGAGAIGDGTAQNEYAGLGSAHCAASGSAPRHADDATMAAVAVAAIVRLVHLVTSRG